VDDLLELVSWAIEKGIGFGSFFDGARFLSARSEGHEVANEVEQEIIPELAPYSFIAGLGDGGAVLADGIDGSLEADPFQWSVMEAGGLGHDAAD
jgi:hypothetical protein